jgi:hypothetical protein
MQWETDVVFPIGAAGHVAAYGLYCLELTIRVLDDHHDAGPYKITHVPKIVGFVNELVDIEAVCK